MKKILLCFILVMAINGCMKQKQEQQQQQITNNYIVERPNFNAVPWESIKLIGGVGESKINLMKDEFKKGSFLSGKDFEIRMNNILSPEMIGKIGDKYDFEAVVE